MPASSAARQEVPLYARGLERFQNHVRKVKVQAGWMAATGFCALFLHMVSLRVWDMTTLIKTAVPGTIPANFDVILSLVLSLAGFLVPILGLITLILLGSILTKIVDVAVNIAAHIKPRS